ncbi:U32 family peptidase [Thermoanaerobacterium thermosaccharolyticum]|jgi:collagenase-like PrtC family protease|uniref:U32 family peptidase n=1 Tax=Thermoanaerobacterium thermosaccharolyticum TaxID=1517 RepID=UPI00279BA30D|nr:U32 family peptidase [Thermoanaerobacterium thermosaccharolyticum]
MKFSIPYNGYNEFIKKIVNKYGESINEIYLSPSKLITSTGRSNDAYNKYYSETTDEYEKKIHDLMSFAEKNGVKINFLINGSFINYDYYAEEGFEKLYRYIDKYYKNGYLTGITIIDPYLLEKLNKLKSTEWKHLELHASVNMYANSVNRVLILQELGINSVCIDRDINRNMQLLRNIKANTNVEIKIMVNEGCLLGCPFRRYHHERKEVYTGCTELLLDLRKSLVERFNRPITNKLAYCLTKYENDLQQIFRSPFIRPEDLHYYEGIADTFKIAGREMSCERLETIIKAYIEQSYDGNLWYLIFRFSEGIPIYINNKEIPDNFHEMLTTCNSNCQKCGYCKKLADKLVKMDINKKSRKWKVPERGESLFQIGLGYYELGKYEKSLECLVKAKENNFTNKTLLSLIEKCKQKLYKEAKL